LLTLLIFLSGLLTFLRYTNYFPFLNPHIRDLVVNINGTRVGGALMSTVFSSLNYVTGFLFFGIVLNTVRSREYLKKILLALSASAVLTFVFAFVQRFYSLDLGNTSFFVNMGQLNSTFKDPNSFGLFVAASLPVWLGMIFTFKKFPKIFFSALIIVALVSLFWIGSRSAILGLGFGISVFVILSLSRIKAKWRMKHIIIILIVVMILACIVFFSQETILYERTIQKLDIVGSRNFVRHLLGVKKLGCWQTAALMIRKYPVTGVGVGAYIIELPNFAGALGLTSVLSGYTDSAENYFLHITSEMGLIGLVIALWLMMAIFRIMRASFKAVSTSDKDQYILIGLISGLTVVFISFFFHSYVGAFDAKYFIWLMVGSVCFYPHQGKDSVERKKLFDRSYKYAALILCVLFGALFLRVSLTDLSLPRSTLENRIDQNFGLYPSETGPDGVKFRWAKKEAGISVTKSGHELSLPIRASHPGIEKHPVSVDIFLSDPMFSEKTLIGRLVLKDSLWHDFTYSLREISKEKIYLLFESDRDWQPKKSLGINDPRWLAIALGDPQFRSLQGERRQ
jgi:O-antigen ligase